MRKAKASEKIKTGGYSVWQKTKYYILVVILVGALFGANLAGWLDPFSFFYRSMAMAVFPLVNESVEKTIYSVNLSSVNWTVKNMIFIELMFYITRKRQMKTSHSTLYRHISLITTYYTPCIE